MAKVFITYTLPAIAENVLREAGHEIMKHAGEQPLSPEELSLAMHECDAIITMLTDKIGATVLQQAGPQLKIIANYAVGYDNIDVASARARGIVITNTPDVLNEAVAEHTLALLIALARRVVEADAFTRAGKYEGWRPLLLLGTQLSGKTLGIVGVGRIGVQVAKKARHGLGMEIVYHDLKPNAELEQAVGARFVSTLDELLPQADAVSLHVPLVSATIHLINTDRLKQMKAAALLVNTSRGAVVDEAALVDALRSGTIRGAALDVFEHEPALTPGLTALPNVILTPHIASATTEARDAMAKLCADNVVAVLSGTAALTPVHL